MSTARSVLRNEFTFLNQTTRLRDIDWCRRYINHLWSYNLHYFDYALDLARAGYVTGDRRYVERLQELVDGWISATGSGKGDGWEPYAISLRVVNWAYALWVVGEQVDPEVRRRMAGSIAAQLAYLERRLERHILANHLQKNYKALAVGGLYLAGPDAERWARKGVAGMWRELFEQVLPDGCHYERSPMYHAIALRDYLEVIDLLTGLGAEIPAPVDARVREMVRAFGVLSRPDGSLHLFNDSADGIAPTRGSIRGLAQRVLGEDVPDPESTVALPHAGYYGLIDLPGGDRLLVDCGEPGPRYQPGHAHCDMLSFELDLDGRPVVVDSGVSGYDGDPLRSYVRGTRAHNTVAIGDRDQSEIWGTFRMARRARPGSVEQTVENGVYRFSGSCTPYHDRKARHRRRIGRQGGEWKVIDRVEGAAGEPVGSFLHIHPEFAATLDGGSVTLRAGEREYVIETFGFDRVNVQRGVERPAQGWYCPQFGVALPAPAIEMRIDANDGREFGYIIRRARK